MKSELMRVSGQTVGSLSLGTSFPLSLHGSPVLLPQPQVQPHYSLLVNLPTPSSGAVRGGALEMLD